MDTEKSQKVPVINIFQVTCPSVKRSTNAYDKRRGSTPASITQWHKIDKQTSTYIIQMIQKMVTHWHEIDNLTSKYGWFVCKSFQYVQSVDILPGAWWTSQYVCWISKNVLAAITYTCQTVSGIGHYWLRMISTSKHTYNVLFLLTLNNKIIYTFICLYKSYWIDSSSLSF